MTGGLRRTIGRASTVALVVGAVVNAGGALPVAAAAPGGPYHFAPGPAKVVDVVQPGPRLAAGSVTPVPADTYLNFLAHEPQGHGVTLTFTPCGGGPSRTLFLSDGSPSLFFTGEGTCMSPNVATYLLAYQIATIGDVSDDGFRYVRIADEPTVFDASGPGQALPSGQYGLDLGGWVPADADGIAVQAWARTDETAVGVAVEPCSQAPNVPQLRTGTIGFGDANVIHVKFRFDQRVCLRIGVGAPGTSVAVRLLGYFTDGLPAGGDTPPAFESFGELRPGLVPVDPTRVLDTRVGLGAAAGPVAAGGTVVLDVGGLISPDTAALTLNVTATNAAADGYVTAFPCAEGLPESSNLNYRSGADVPNLVLVEPDADGRICLYTSAATHLLADLGGTYEWGRGAGFLDEGPRRLLDTRRTTGPAAAGSVTRVTVQSSNGEAALGATVNLTAVDARSSGYITAYPCDRSRPEVSNLNYVAGQTVATLSTVKVGPGAELCLYSSGQTDLLVDLAGTYTESAAGRLRLTSPLRWFDTRAEGPATESQTVWEFGVGPSLLTASAIIANLTATGVEEPGFYTGFDCAPDIPEASNLNYQPRTDVANLAFVPLGPGQHYEWAFCLYNMGTTHELIDIFGWLTSDLAWSTLVFGIDV